MVGEGAAERRRLERPAALEEERLAEPLLEHRECPRHRRLGQPDQRRAFGDAAGLDHRGELNQMALVDLHSDPVY